jgi:hypothetical protein
MTPMIQTLWSVAATVSLGSVALWQNVRYKNLSDEKDETYKRLENECMRLLNLPFLSINTISVDRVLLKNREGNFKHPEDEPEVFMIDSDLVETILVNREGVRLSGDVTGIKREEQPFVISVRNTGNNSANNVRVTFTLHGKQYAYAIVSSYAKHEDRKFFYVFEHPDEEEIELQVRFTYEDIFQNGYEQTFEVHSIRREHAKPQRITIHIIKSEQVRTKKTIIPEI